jgi:hypothetical protein
MARAPKIEARQKIEARLWQDPFAAIAKYAHKAKNARNGDLTATEADPDDSGKCAPFKDQLDADAEVLGVMLPGGPYAELSEVRRRTRYAVLSGLERRDYIGKTQGHIGCWTPKDTKGRSLTDVPREIPFEWFRQKSNENHRLLVLWLNEDLFGWPLKGISTVLDVLDKVGAQNSTVKIVGPYTSDALERMIKEAPSKEAPPKNTKPLPDERENQTVAAARTPGEGRSASSRQRTATPVRVATAGVDPSPGNKSATASLPAKGPKGEGGLESTGSRFFLLVRSHYRREPAS